jgi:hypothetical protein
VTLEDADAELLEANATLRWQVGRPTYHHERDEWQMVAFDPKERPKPGKPRQRIWTTIWTTIGPTEELCVRNMAYCLREIVAGRVPK